MNKISLVARHEFISTLKRRSALFAIFGLPVLSLLVLGGINWLARSQGSADSSLLSEFVSDDEAPLPAGLVDDTGQIVRLSPPADTMFVLLPDLTAARAAFEAGEIRRYYHIPADYLANGTVYQYADAVSLDSSEEYILYGLLAANFIGDSAPAPLVAAPLQEYEEVDLSASKSQSEQGTLAALAIALGVGVLFYLTVMGASGYLLQSLGVEKQNRVMEILLSSVRPFELLAGKVLGLGGIGLLQIGVWSLLAILVFRPGQNPFGNIVLPTLTTGTWIITILFFVTGYLVYASLFAGLGAIAPSVKEGSQYTFILIAPTFLPMWFNSIMISAPNGPFATALSLIPITASLAMPMRLAVTAVPAWQWLLSLGISVATAVFLLRTATKFFRSQTLLTGQNPSLRLIWQTLREA